jgi:DNA helicase II / ATP-dependent DNA helicase PcrA
MDFLQGLNPQQQQAVSHCAGPLLILAGAGSGKTRVITSRVAYLIGVKKVPAHAVLAVTFTNKAAGEMRARIAALLDRPADSAGPTVATFHSFCVRLLRRDGDRLADLRSGFTRQFTIYDEDDQLALVKSAYRGLELDEKFMPYRTAISRISHHKNRKETSADIRKDARDPKTARFAAIFDAYEEGLRQANALDFDDLLLEAVRLLHHDEATRELYRRRYQYVLIDEYQDTNRSQYELMLLIAGGHKNICVVGDEDQSIYGWRGADIRNILDFEKDFPGAVVIRLEQNYRSTQNVLDAAGAVVANNVERKGKTLWTEAAPGDRIGLFEAPDAETEAGFIADTIDEILMQSPGERVAILYRTNAQSRQIEEALRRRGRKYLVVGGFSFYQRAEVKDSLAYLKLMASRRDDMSLLRVINTPARGIGRTTIEQVERHARGRKVCLWEALVELLDTGALAQRAAAALGEFRRLMEELREAAGRLPLDETLKLILDRTGYRKMLETDIAPGAESRLENLDELVNATAEAVERGEALAEFLDNTALASDADSVDTQSQISLLTLHNAKGLEFPVVFLAGCEEKLFPHSRSYDSEAMMEEERRLCYVGMTRAEKKLYLTWCRLRRRFGGGPAEPCLPSRFLSEIPARLTVTLTRRGWDNQVDLFAERHEVRQTVKKNLYTGKTYNSMENISQFFTEHGMSGFVPPPVAASPKPVAQSKPAPAARKAAGGGIRKGAVVRHQVYGRGTIVRIEGEGDDTKVTVSFSGHGLKKLIAKYAGLKADE